MDPTDPNNYRPISNLSFLSKLLERTVDDALIAADRGMVTLVMLI